VIRLAWRQFRGQAAVAAGALAAVAIVSAVTSVHSRHDSGLRTWLGVLVVVAPGVLGLFWGAPLVAGELEAGTFRLTWTQSVTRTRWLAARAGLAVLGGAAAAGILSLVATWWAGPADRAGRDLFGTFDQRDLVPVGYAAFAVALGITAGLLIRRTVPAMAVTLVAFVAARAAETGWLRPVLAAPSHLVLALNPATTGYGSSVSGLGIFAVLVGAGPKSTLQPARPDLPDAWITSTRIVGRGGRELTGRVLRTDCPGQGQHAAGSAGGRSHSHAPAAVQQALQACVTKVGGAYHELVTYQPAGHYWLIQGLELTAFLGAAAVLAGFCWWRIRRTEP
jgi:hypothetical protein